MLTELYIAPDIQRRQQELTADPFSDPLERAKEAGNRVNPPRQKR